MRQRMWLMGMMCLASLVGGAMSNMFLTERLGAQGAQVVTASQVNIVDGAGRLRAVLAGDDEQGLASLAFFDPDGRRRATLGLQPDGTPALTLNDEAGTARFSAGVRAEEATVVVGQEAARHVLVGTLGGTPVVGLVDGGRMRLQANLGSEGGEPQVSFVNGAGRRAIGLAVGSDDAPIVSLYDPAGAQRVAIGTIQGATVVNLGDGTRPRLVFGVAEDGYGSVGYYDATGNLVRLEGETPGQP